MQERNKLPSWHDEDQFWRRTFSTRPYTSSSPNYEVWRGGYRYGYDAAKRYPDREWHEVEPELSHGWTSYEHRTDSAWEHVKAAVRDAWDRVTHHSTVTK